MQAQAYQEENNTTQEVKANLAQFDDLVEPPVIDMQLFLNKTADTDNETWLKECRKVAYSFNKFGICIVRDPRVNHSDNESYIDMVERYFESISASYYAGEELADMRPELSFQTGVTPESMEKARDHEQLANSLPDADKPRTMYPQDFDAKWRFFWPIGERPAEI